MWFYHNVMGPTYPHVHLVQKGSKDDSGILKPLAEKKFLTMQHFKFCSVFSFSLHNGSGMN